jgi:hypothetical protein
LRSPCFAICLRWDSPTIQNAFVRYASELLHEGASVGIIQEQLGHTSIVTIAPYLTTSPLRQSSLSLRAQMVKRNKTKEVAQVTLVVLALLILLLGSHVALLALGPWYGIATALVALVVYQKMFGRPRGGFGPMWLGMADIVTLLSNVGTICAAFAVIIKHWLR